MLEIDGYRIDAEIESTHSRRADVTTHPVEDGVEIADHVQLDPVEVTVTGVVSARPIGEIADLRDDDPVGEAVTRLTQIYEARKPVTLRTALDEYDDMVMQSLNLPQSAQLGDVVEFTAVFVHVRRITNERTTIPVGLPVAAKRRSRGRLSPRDEIMRGGRIVDPTKPFDEQVPPVVAAPDAVINSTAGADSQHRNATGKSFEEEVNQLTGLGL